MIWTKRIPIISGYYLLFRAKPPAHIEVVKVYGDRAKFSKSLQYGQGGLRRRKTDWWLGPISDMPDPYRMPEIRSDLGLKL